MQNFLRLHGQRWKSDPCSGKKFIWIPPPQMIHNRFLTQLNTSTVTHPLFCSTSFLPDLCLINNSNRNQWSPIHSVITRVITKLDDREAKEPDLLITSMFTDSPEDRRPRALKQRPCGLKWRLTGLKRRPRGLKWRLTVLKRRHCGLKRRTTGKIGNPVV